MSFPQINAPEDVLGASLKKVRDENCDFILSVEGQEWKVHKLVLCMHSDVLYKMATSSQFVESRTGRAELKDVDARHVDAMVHYFYHLDDGMLSPELVPEGETRVEFMLGLAKVADMYNVQSLVQLVTYHMRLRLSQAEKKEAIRKTWEMEGVPGDLKTASVEIAVENLSFFGTDEGQDLVNRRPELAVEIVKRQGKRELERGAWRVSSMPSPSWGFGGSDVSVSQQDTVSSQ